ncbi:hypothetical protein K443DRAFT_686752 [Laccaria amethystina LaAM-08-1]|uniref:Uncharacterized protein n=1 Tax=Laccaria amethystina LaAM-08-1 TaxID=1095629 RepID=A0A0C9X1N3_9AGAR|nr:hypothetical protein K443DRAFT_686752 [Laccaria amethystina LaAM-08-1]
MSQLHQEHPAPAPGQTSSDGRGGSDTVKRTTKVPRYCASYPTSHSDQSIRLALTAFSILPPLHQRWANHLKQPHLCK